MWRIPPILDPYPPNDACEHEWEFFEDEAARPYTGYLERCKKCKKIVQIPQ